MDALCLALGIPSQSSSSFMCTRTFHNSSAHAETVSYEAMEVARLQHRQSTPGTVATVAKSVASGLTETVAVLTRNGLFLRLTLITMASGLVIECMQDLLFNYFMITMGFGSADNSRILTVLGALGLGVQV